MPRTSPSIPPCKLRQDAASATVTHTDAEGGSETLSKISCHNCRRRKVRCDRKIPVCSICTHNGQQCSYPDRMLKPGPKLGSKNVRNKRRRLTDGGDNDEDMVPEFPGNEGPEHSDPDQSNDSRRTVSLSSSTSNTTTTTTALRTPKDIQSLSFIIHPSHEPTSPSDPNCHQFHRPSQLRRGGGPDAPTSLSPAVPPPPSGSVIVAACASLRITPDILNGLVENFFRTFLSFRLFAESRFWTQTLQISDANTVKALMASIAAFSVKQWEPTAAQMGMDSVVSGLSPTRLIDVAMKAASTALADCGDETPPLALLQALVLVSHWLLIQECEVGRGGIWGVCIRVAYELNLHLVDAGRLSSKADVEPRRWALDEEKRRVWWTIWEMDVFASVIRRCPTAISWLQNETFLPSEDNMWEQQIPQRSCVLEINTMNRCKTLQATGNHSPRAWFVVINSIMKDAQTISSPVGVNTLGAGSERAAYTTSGGGGDGSGHNCSQQSHGSSSRRIDEARKRLTTFFNAARYFSMALPQNLKYRGQYLNFEPTSAVHVKAGTKTLRELHAQIYSIHLMTQLAYLMTLKYQLFRTTSSSSAGAAGTAGRARSPSTPTSSNRDSHTHNNQHQQLPDSHRRHSCSTCPSTASHPHPCNSAGTSPSVLAYFEASTSILDITHRCAEQFFHFVNPFLGNIIWLAAAVQLLRRELYTQDETEKELVNSNFEVLRMAYETFVDYWRSDGGGGAAGGGGRGNEGCNKGGGGSMDLDALEGQLRAFQERASGAGGSRWGGKGEKRREEGAGGGFTRASLQEQIKFSTGEGAGGSRSGGQMHYRSASVAGQGQGVQSVGRSHADNSRQSSSSNFHYPSNASKNQSYASSSLKDRLDFSPQNNTPPSATGGNNFDGAAGGSTGWPSMSLPTTTSLNSGPNANLNTLISRGSSSNNGGSSMSIDSSANTNTVAGYGDSSMSLMPGTGDFGMQDGQDDGELMMMMFDPYHAECLGGGFDFLGAGGGGGFGGAGAAGGGAAGGGGGMWIGDGGEGGGYNTFDDIFSGSIF